MSLQHVFPVLKDCNGHSIRCNQPGCRRMARHIHHIVPRCEGGSDDGFNLTMLCQKCHAAIHSERGDFARWGKQGGAITAQKMVSIPNLKQFQGPDGQARWERFCQRRANAQMGVQV